VDGIKANGETDTPGVNPERTVVDNVAPLVDFDTIFKDTVVGLGVGFLSLPSPPPFPPVSAGFEDGELEEGV
jgi:hypothetical protein